MKKLIASQAAILLMFFTTLATPRVKAEDLLSLYKSAMQDNPTLKIRELGIERAKADADIAVSRLYPQVNLHVSQAVGENAIVLDAIAAYCVSAVE